MWWPIAALSGGVIVAAAATDTLPGAVRAALTWRPVVYIGAISYGMYLWHLLPQVALDALISGGGAVVVVVHFTLALAVTVVIAALSFRFIEKPILLRFKQVQVDPATSRNSESDHSLDEYPAVVDVARRGD